MSLDLPVLLGTARDGARSRPLAQLVERLLHARGHRTRLHDAAALPFGNMIQPEWTMEPRPPEVEAFVREMGRADGFVLVFPEYNHGYPGALKNVLDHVFDEWNRKPFALVSVGGMSGGLRAQENLLPVLRAIQGVAVPASVVVQGVARGVDEADVARRVNAMLDDLEWWARGLKAARDASAAAAPSPPLPIAG